MSACSGFLQLAAKLIYQLRNTQLNGSWFLLHCLENSSKGVNASSNDFILNKKVLLRESKRHTARRVASARHAALSNGWGGGELPYPVLVVGEYPWYPPPSRPGLGGYLPTIQTWPGGIPQVPPTIQTWDGVPPHPDLGWGTPIQTCYGVPPHPDLGRGTPTHKPGTGYSPSHKPGTGYLPPPRNGGQSENITFRHPSNAGGKNCQLAFL